MKVSRLFVLNLVVLLICANQVFASNTLMMDFDTPETGSNFGDTTSVTTPLSTPYGTVSLFADTAFNDNGWIAPCGFWGPAGCVGNHLFIENMGEDYGAGERGIGVGFLFDFDVQSVSFIYGGGGGGAGSFYAEVSDVSGNILDSFYNESTQNGQAYDPVTLTGSNIRKIAFKDATANSVAVDSLTVTVVPEPISSILFITGGATLGIRRFRKKGFKI